MHLQVLLSLPLQPAKVKGKEEIMLVGCPAYTNSGQEYEESTAVQLDRGWEANQAHLISRVCLMEILRPKAS